MSFILLTTGIKFPVCANISPKYLHISIITVHYLYLLCLDSPHNHFHVSVGVYGGGYFLHPLLPHAASKSIVTKPTRICLLSISNMCFFVITPTTSMLVKPFLGFYLDSCQLTPKINVINNQKMVSTLYARQG